MRAGGIAVPRGEPSIARAGRDCPSPLTPPSAPKGEGAAGIGQRIRRGDRSPCCLGSRYHAGRVLSAGYEGVQQSIAVGAFRTPARLGRPSRRRQPETPGPPAFSFTNKKLF